jgi:hypothetical protein
MENIPRGVAVELFQPPCPAIRWGGAVAAPLVPMPKASMHENHRSVFAQNDVRSARETISMKAESKAQPMQH